MKVVKLVNVFLIVCGLAGQGTLAIPSPFEKRGYATSALSTIEEAQVDSPLGCEGLLNPENEIKSSNIVKLYGESTDTITPMALVRIPRANAGEGIEIKTLAYEISSFTESVDASCPFSVRVFKNGSTIQADADTEVPGTCLINGKIEFEQPIKTEDTGDFVIEITPVAANDTSCAYVGHFVINNGHGAQEYHLPEIPEGEDFPSPVEETRSNGTLVFNNKKVKPAPLTELSDKWNNFPMDCVSVLTAASVANVSVVNYVAGPGASDSEAVPKVLANIPAEKLTYFVSKFENAQNKMFEILITVTSFPKDGYGTCPDFDVVSSIGNTKYNDSSMFPPGSKKTCHIFGDNLYSSYPNECAKILYGDHGGGSTSGYNPDGNGGVYNPSTYPQYYYPQMDPDSPEYDPNFVPPSPIPVEPLATPTPIPIIDMEPAPPGLKKRQVVENDSAEASSAVVSMYTDDDYELEGETGFEEPHETDIAHPPACPPPPPPPIAIHNGISEPYNPDTYSGSTSVSTTTNQGQGSSSNGQTGPVLRKRGDNNNNKDEDISEEVIPVSCTGNECSLSSNVGPVSSEPCEGDDCSSNYIPLISPPISRFNLFNATSPFVIKAYPAAPDAHCVYYMAINARYVEAIYALANAGDKSGGVNNTDESAQINFGIRQTASFGSWKDLLTIFVAALPYFA